MHCRGWIVLIAAMMLAACSSGKSPPPDRVGAAQGIGTVVEIDPQQYTATVETADRRILCYWTQDTIFIYKNQAMKNYVPAVGTQIAFKGIESRGEVFIVQAVVVKAN